jgi:GTP cyclohydrolase I
MANDFELGKQISRLLIEKGLETPFNDPYPFPVDDNFTRGVIETHHQSIMEALNLDLMDDSLAETPSRVSKMYAKEIFTGLNYENFPKCTTVENKMQYDEMVCVDNIEVKSMCEHHFLPFIGMATVAYIPGNKILGLSKFNRIVDFFARRPQIQERLTEQISEALRYILDTEDVAVVIRADHYCVKLRGVEDFCSNTITSKLSGRFKEKPELRQEFLALARSGK